jgi:hypothetical protein
MVTQIRCAPPIIPREIFRQLANLDELLETLFGELQTKEPQKVDHSGSAAARAARAKLAGI